MHRHFLVLLFLFACLPALAADRWIRLQSANFELFSTAGEGRAKDTLRDLERVSNFFEQAFGRPVKPDVPLRVVLLRDEKEFQAYRPGEVATAFFATTPSGDVIAMYPAGDDSIRIVIHEFVHFLIRESGVKNWPLWLNEGVAELYSTLRPLGNKVQIGGLLPGRMIVFRTEKPIPLRDMLAAGANSPLYSQKRHAGMFYAQAWALTHMLKLQADYRDGFNKFLQLLAEKHDSVTAIETAFGRPIARVQKDLDAYMREQSFFGMNVDVKMSGKAEVALDPPTAAQVAATRVTLLTISQKLDDASKLLDAELAASPKDPDLHIAKGFLHYRGVRYDLARESFKQAYEFGTSNKRILQGLARMSMPNDPETATAALQRIVQGGDPSLDVRLMLADAYVRGKKFGAAHSALSSIAKVTPEEAYRVFVLRAQAEDGMNLPGALETAKRAQQFAPDERREYIGRLVQYLEQKREYATRKPGAIAPPQAPQEPGEVTGNIQHRSPDGKDLHKVEGKFTELVCRGDQAVVVLKLGAQSTVRLVITDPNRLISTDAGQNKALEFTCGAQKGRDVVAWFDDVPHAATSSAGVLWELHLQP